MNVIYVYQKRLNSWYFLLGIIFYTTEVSYFLLWFYDGISLYFINKFQTTHNNYTICLNCILRHQRNYFMLHGTIKYKKYVQ